MRILLFSIIATLLMFPLVEAPRIDNLNIIQDSAIITIDTSNPVINNITFTNFANNSFVSRTLINITYNVSDAYNNSILFYVNGVKNATFGYISNSSQNATLTIATEGNYTILFEANDSANNKLNSSFLYVAIDLTLPSSSAYSNVSVSGGEIRTNTNVNVSLNISDIYTNNITISHNASSGTLSNHLLTNIGNATYHYIIGSGNLSAGQVVGWNATAFDLAGNKLETNTFSFLINAVPSSPSTPSGGGGSSVTIPQSLQQSVNPFGAPSSDGTCPSGEQVFDGNCYPCDPIKGYLKFNPDDRSVLCVMCSEGFVRDGEGCKLAPPRSVANKLNIVLDDTAKKISSLLKTDNPMAGYIVMIVLGAVVANVAVTQLNKRPRNDDDR